MTRSNPLRKPKPRNYQHHLETADRASGCICGVLMFGLLLLFGGTAALRFWTVLKGSYN